MANMTEQEYNDCVDQHADNLFRFALKTMKDRDEANNIVQDAFEKLWKHRKQVDPKKKKSYLFTTAYHFMLDELKRNQRYTDIDTTYDTRSSHNNYNDIKEIIDQGLERLPQVQRSVLMLRDYEGYSYEDIAEMTQLNLSQVKVYIFRARVALKKYIGKMESVL